MKKAVSKKFIGTIIGITFVIAAFFGVSLTMQMDSREVMQNCPLFGHTESVCTMTATEHIAKWRQLFTVTISSNKFLFTALLLIGLACAAFSFQFSLFNQLNFQTLRNGAGPPGHASGFLLRALGSGILRKRE